MNLNKKQLATAHHMEAGAILLAGDFLNDFGETTKGMMLLMLTLKVIQDAYPQLYPNVSNAGALITEWLATGAAEISHPLFEPSTRRKLAFPNKVAKTPKKKAGTR